MSTHTQDRAGATRSVAANQKTTPTSRTAARSTGRQGRRGPQRSGAGNTHRKARTTTFTATGTYSQHPRGFGFINLTTPHQDGETVIDSIFVNPTTAATLVSGDVVTTVATINAGRAAAGRRVEVLERTRTHVFGRVQATATGTLVLATDPSVSAGVWDLPTTGPAATVTEGTWLYAAVEASPGRTSLGKVTRIVETHEQMTPAAVRRMMFARFDVDTARDAALDAEGARIARIGRKALAKAPQPGRVSMEGTTTFTIDGPHSRDLDDAVSAYPVPDGIRVHVHIADVSALIAPGSRLDVDAYAYATSIYLPGWNRPMLPPQLSEDVLSLLPGVARDTLTVAYTVTESGQVTDASLDRTRIVSDARLTYDGASAVLDGTGTGDPVDAHVRADVETALRHAHAAAQRLGTERGTRLELADRDRAVATWEADVQVSDAADRYDGATWTTSRPKAPTTADVLIERLMVAANEAVASWLLARDLPGVFRVHAAPAPDLTEDIAALLPHLPAAVRASLGTPAAGVTALADLAGALGEHGADDRLVDVLLMRHLKRATYTADRGDHYGLGSKGYSHFTSPIRRYADLLVHRVIVAHLAGDDAAVAALRQQLPAAAAHVTEASWTAARIESGFRRFATELLVARQVDAPVTGVVTGFSPAGAFVNADEHGVSGILRFEDMPGTWTPDPRKVAATDAASNATLVLGSTLQVSIRDVEPGLGGITWARAARPRRRRGGRNRRR